MTTRTRRRQVTFQHPFSLRGIDGQQPAGTYTIETEEELLEQLSFTAYHRVSTTLVLPTGAHSYEMAKVDPADLEAAEARDGQAQSELPQAT